MTLLAPKIKGEPETRKGAATGEGGSFMLGVQTYYAFVSHMI